MSEIRGERQAKLPPLVALVAREVILLWYVRATLGAYFEKIFRPLAPPPGHFEILPLKKGSKTPKMAIFGPFLGVNFH